MNLKAETVKPLEGKIREFDCSRYSQKGPHRKKCRGCGRLISDGEYIHAELWRKQKLYPIKGIMYFSTWRFWHIDCHQRALNGPGRNQ